MNSTTWDYAQDFYASFQSSRSNIETRFAALKATPNTEELENLAVELAKLTKNLADASGSLPSYDQRQCELGMKALEKDFESLRVAAAPKAKFVFKRKAGPSTSPAPVSAPALSPASTPIIESVAKVGVTESLSITKNIIISSHSQRYLNLTSLPLTPSNSLGSSLTRDLTIADLDACVVNLIPHLQGGSGQEEGATQIGALHIRNISDSLLFLPQISGSALLHDMQRCVVVVGCHQFRMHTSVAIDVHLGIPSTPVIEHCSRIRFGPYPLSLYSSSFAGVGKEGDGKYADVQDFSHVRATPSPNWRLLPTSSGSEHGWEDLLGEGTRKSDKGELGEAAKDILDLVLPIAG